MLRQFVSRRHGIHHCYACHNVVPSLTTSTRLWYHKSSFLCSTDTSNENNSDAGTSTTSTSTTTTTATTTHSKSHHHPHHRSPSSSSHHHHHHQRKHKLYGSSNNHHHSTTTTTIKHKTSSPSTTDNTHHRHGHHHHHHHHHSRSSHHQPQQQQQQHAQQQQHEQQIQQQFGEKRYGRDNVHRSRVSEVKAAYATKSMYRLDELKRVPLGVIIERHEPELNHFNFETFQWRDSMKIRLTDDHLSSLSPSSNTTNPASSNTSNTPTLTETATTSETKENASQNGHGAESGENETSSKSESSSSYESPSHSLYESLLQSLNQQHEQQQQAELKPHHKPHHKQHNDPTVAMSDRDSEILRENRIIDLDVRRVRRVLNQVAEGNRSMEFKRSCPVMNFEQMWFSFTTFIISGAQYGELSSSSSSPSSASLPQQREGNRQHQENSSFLLDFLPSTAKSSTPLPTTETTSSVTNSTLIPPRLAVHLFRVLLDYTVAHTDAFTKTSLNETEQGVIEQFIQPFFASYTKHVHPDDYALYLEGLQYCNFTDPQLHFLRNKRLRRKIIYHVGPTNSGKTYHALLEMSRAQSGIYMAPLRLLAQEVCNRMNTNYGTKCSLLTGQERRDVIGANHAACTIEMLNLSQVYHVAVIDEIQMIQDAERGQAWTQALLGVQAQEIHLCGDHTAIDLVNRVLKNNGDETVEVRRYDRMTELQLWPEGSLGGDVHKIQKRDCVIVFSRKHIFEVKQFIEVHTGLRCAVVYGGLPPESRKEQAELFNDETSGYDVLIATDAVGMGLNLNIKRIVFFTTSKPTLTKNRIKSMPVDYMLMKQIAGRAGRRGFYDIGYVTTFEQKDFEYLKQSLAYEMKSIESAGIFPSLQQLQGFAKKFPEHSADMASILSRYIVLSKGHKDFFLCHPDAKIEIATRIRHLKLTLAQQYTFMNAPIPSMEEALNYLVQYCEDFANPAVHVVPIRVNVRKILTGLREVQERDEGKLNNRIMRHVVTAHGSSDHNSYDQRGRQRNDALKKVEFAMKILDAYKWLAQRFPAKFDNELVEAAQDTIIEEIGKSLVLHTRQNKKDRSLTALNTTAAALQTEQQQTEDTASESEQLTYAKDDIFTQFTEHLMRN